VNRRRPPGIHGDGSICPEGTARRPRPYKPCCRDFDRHTLACFFDIRYEWWPRYRGWFNIISPSAGGGGIALNFCPHCGKRLPGIRRSGRYLEA
jgi:hypothetical protein